MIGSIFVLWALLMVHINVDMFSQQAIQHKSGNDIVSLLLHGSILGAALTFFGFKFALITAAMHLLVDYSFWRKPNYSEDKKATTINQLIHLGYMIPFYFLADSFTHSSFLFQTVAIIICFLSLPMLAYLGYTAFHKTTQQVICSKDKIRTFFVLSLSAFPAALFVAISFKP